MQTKKPSSSKQAKSSLTVVSGRKKNAKRRPAGSSRSSSKEQIPTETLTKIGVESPKQTRSEQSLERMLVATEVILVRDGWDALTMQAIADEAGMSVGGIYRRFPSKVHLMRAMKDRVFSRIDGRHTDIAEYESVSLEDAVAHFVEVRVKGAHKSRRLMKELLEGHEEDPISMQRVSRSWTHSIATFEHIVAPYKKEVKRSDHELAVEMVSFMLNATIVRLIRNSDGDRPFRKIGWKTISAEMTAMILAYLRTKG